MSCLQASRCDVKRGVKPLSVDSADQGCFGVAVLIGTAFTLRAAAEPFASHHGALIEGPAPVMPGHPGKGED